MNANHKKSLPHWLPFAVGAFLVVQFAALSVWQISRGLEKRASANAYKSEVTFAPWQQGDAVRSYQRIEVQGRYDSERQVLLENIVLNGRLGLYVLSAVDIGPEQPLLLVNRGWLQQQADNVTVETLALPDAALALRGRVGTLPRAGIKMGEAVNASDSWPKSAVYPSLAELAAVYGVELQPFVLLLNHEEPHGFYRHWVPTEFGPGKHFGYALQWFAMGAVLAGLLIWNYRKKKFA